MTRSLDIWHLPNYFWFHPETKEFKGFQLVNQNYEAIYLNEQGWLWSDEMGLFVGIHTDGLLRLFSPDGALILTRTEEAEQQVNQERSLKQLAQQQQQYAEQERDQERSLNTQIQQDLDQERQRAEVERLRAERLAERLRQMGLDPDEF